MLPVMLVAAGTTASHHSRSKRRLVLALVDVVAAPCQYCFDASDPTVD
jgi:hypothetical protein